MIGQVAALRDAVTTVADLHRDVSPGQHRAADGAAGARARARAGAAATGGRRDRRRRLHPPGRAGRRDVLGEHPRQVDAISEVPASAGTGAVLRPRPARARQGVLALGRVHRPGRVRSAGASGMPPKSLRLDRAVPAARPAVRPGRPRRRRLRERPFDRRAHLGDPRRRRRRSRHVGRLHGPLGAAVAAGRRSRRSSSSSCSSGSPSGPRTASPGLLMNVAAGRIANRLDFGGTNYTVDAACASSLAAIGARRSRAAGRDQRHGARGRRRRDPEPVRVPLLRQDARAVADGPLPAVRRGRRRHRDQRGVRDGRAQAPGRRRARRRSHLCA